MDTVKGDRWISDYASWIRIHEAKLGDAARRVITTNTKPTHPRSDPNATGSGIVASLWSAVGLRPGTTTIPAPASNAPNGRPSHQPVRPLTLRLNPHYLYYLLIRFEALALPVGSLDVKIPASARPTSYFSFVSATSAKDKDDTTSMSSFRSRMSAVSSSFSVASSWWGTSSAAAAADPTRDIKYIYAALTKIPSLRLGPNPAAKLIEEFEDCPGKCAVPLDVFKNLQFLELEEVDPRTLLGWDRVSMQLRSLTCKKSGLEDLSDLAIDLVIHDARRRRGERPSQVTRRIHYPTGVADSEATTETETETEPDAEVDGAAAASKGQAETSPSRTASPSPPPELPSLSWHFLRYLNLSNNSLTFVPSMPLKAMEGLTNIDLSSNLLNVVPPALVHLPNLTSLNINDNLIDSVLGIYDTLKAIRVLNLAKNRLESLCGLERLYTLERIDLRTNCIYEAGEVGRLAPLPSIKEVWVKDNPLEDELPDFRVDCFVEFAKEGRSVLLDGQAAGFFEKQRIAERVPNATHAIEAAGRLAPSCTTEEEAQTALEATQGKAVVKSVKHRGSVAQRKAAHTERRHGAKQAVADASSPPSGQHGITDRVDRKVSASSSSSSAAMSRDASREALAAKRRNRRVVDLESTPKKAQPADADQVQQSKAEVTAAEPSLAPTTTRLLSESERIKEAATSGDTMTGPASVSDFDQIPAEPQSSKAAGKAPLRPQPLSSSRSSSSSRFQRPSSMHVSASSGAVPGLTSTSRLTWSKRAGAAAASLSMEDWSSLQASSSTLSSASSSLSPSSRGVQPAQAGSSRSAAASAGAPTSRGGPMPTQTLFAISPALADLPNRSPAPALHRSNTVSDTSPSRTIGRASTSSSTLGRSAGTRLSFLQDSNLATNKGRDPTEPLSSSSSSSGGRSGAAADTDSLGPPAEASEAQQNARLRVPRPGIGSAAALARRSRVTASLYEPSSADLSSLGGVARGDTGKFTPGELVEEPERLDTAPATGAGTGSRTTTAQRQPPFTSRLTATDAAAAAGTDPGLNRSEAFRRRIEALKGEVGDDWLRLLARGAEASSATPSSPPPVRAKASETLSEDRESGSDHPPGSTAAMPVAARSTGSPRASSARTHTAPGGGARKTKKREAAIG